MQTRIDRKSLVSRHDVRRTSADPLEPISVGNGEFAYTVDVTGMQSLPEFHQDGMPLHTQAEWAWHTAPNPHGYALDDAYESYGGVDYLTTGDPNKQGRHEQAARWLRENPHRIDLGRIGFVRDNGSRFEVGEISQIEQHLDLWQGRIDSAFVVDGEPVRVTTACHPELDLVAIRAESGLLATGELRIRVEFPYAIGDWSEPCDWPAADAHETNAVIGDDRADIRRVLDSDVHHVALTWSEHSSAKQTAAHEIVIRTAGSVELVVGFAPEPLPADLPTARETITAATRHWERFWSTGGAIELVDSTDSRAAELERRIVLSQYLTAINCAGSTPPAETGLVTNSWRGKFHLEMHWWHAAHFPLWNRPALLERSLGWYERILPTARSYAERQGYRGARWPKQIGPEARESPSDVGAFLIWQQSHLIFYAELLRRSAEDHATIERATLDRFAPLVFETADFMADYATFDGKRYNLGPPLTSAQEKAFHHRTESTNPTFELAYWAWGLTIARRWRERFGLPPERRWQEVADSLAPLPIRHGRYVELEHPITRPEGHPTMVGALGFVPDIGVVDHEVMRKTLRHVMTDWVLPDTWGWDYPLLAMTAARLGEPELAVDALLMDSPKNSYLANGHNFQKLPQLPLYLPGNGGLLYAAAMMAGGWDNAPGTPTPGFPDPPNGWRVRVEGLRPAP